MMLVVPVGFSLALREGMAPSTVWSVMWITPIIILVLARAILGEHSTTVAALAALTGVVATWIILEPLPVLPVRAAVWALLMAVSFALYVIMTRVLRFEPMRTNLFYTAPGVFAVLTVYLPRVWIVPTTHDGIVLIGIGVMGFFALLALDRAAMSRPRRRSSICRSCSRRSSSGVDGHANSPGTCSAAHC